VSRQVALIETLPHKRLDDSLAAHIEIASGIVKFLQHSRRNVHVHALNRLNHATLALEEMGNVLSLIG
jgi:hypothetical protein